MPLPSPITHHPSPITAVVDLWTLEATSEYDKERVLPSRLVKYKPIECVLKIVLLQNDDWKKDKIEVHYHHHHPCHFLDAAVSAI
jgi:hypothetical protein